MKIDTRLSIIVTTMLLAACASSATVKSAETAPQTPPTTARAMINIDNNHRDGVAVAVFITPEGGGVRAQLGTVEPNRQGSFAYNAQSGNFTLEAQPLSGTSGNVKSRSFHLANGMVARWTLDPNHVSTGSK
jgi:hypothetical protein